MNQYFNRFRVPIEIDGKPREQMAFTRQGRSGSSNFKSNFVWTGMCDEPTNLKNGDIITAKPNQFSPRSRFMVISVRPSEMSIQATLYQCNGIAHIYRHVEEYDDADNLESSEVRHIASVDTNHVTVNASMRLLDAGLLPSTTKEFRVPMCDIQPMDRIVLEVNGKIEGNFCVDVIDKTKFDGLYAVQTSFDNRTFDGEGDSA